MSDWEPFLLGDVCTSIRSGKNISAKDMRSEGAVPVYGGNGVRGYTSTANFSGECAIIGRQGAYCGNSRYFKGKAYMTEHAVIVRVNEFNDTRFLAYLLSLMNLRRLSGQSAQPGLSVETLSTQRVFLPSLSDQRNVASLLTVIDDKVAVNTQVNDNLVDSLEIVA